METTGPSAEWVARMRELYDKSPVHAHMGLTLEEVGNGTATVRLAVKQEYINGLGVIHGGVITAGLDSALLQPIRSRCADGDHLTTVELKVNFLEPANPPTLTFSGSATRVGSSLGVAHAEALDAQGKHVATAMGTIAIKRRK